MDRSHSFPQKDAGEVRNLEMLKNCAPQKGKVTCWIRGRREEQLPWTHTYPKRPTSFVTTCHLTSSSTKKLQGTVTKDQSRHVAVRNACSPAPRQLSCGSANTPGGRSFPKQSPTILPNHPPLGFRWRHLLERVCWGCTSLPVCLSSWHPYQSSNQGSFSPKVLIFFFLLYSFSFL